jgi:hypothetical protein
VRDELRNGHASSCPWDDALGISLKYVGYQLPHALFFNVEAIEKCCRVHGPKRSLAFLKASGHWDRGTPKERIEMTIHFDHNASDVGDDLMGGPSVA